MSHVTNADIAEILRGIGHTREARAIVGYSHVNRDPRSNPFSGMYEGTTYRTPVRTIVRSLVATFHGKRALAIMDAATVLDVMKRQSKRFTPAERNTLRKPLPKGK